MKSPTLFFLSLIINYLSFAQCWKSIDIKGDTNSYIFAIRDDHTLWDFSTSPNGVQVGNQNIWEKCFSSFASNFLLAQDSTLWGWGYNGYGELGIGNTTPQPTIIQLNNSKWIDVSSSWGNTYAIRQDGTLWFWGYNWPNVSILSPVQVGLDSDWKEVQCDYNKVIALKNNGTLWKGSMNNTLIQVGTENDWKYVWFKNNKWWGIKNNGTLWYDGTQVGTDSDWKYFINEIGSKFYGIKTNGTLWYWSQYDNLGNYIQFNPFLLPTQINSISNIDQVSINMNWTSVESFKLYTIHNNYLWIDQYATDALCPFTNNCNNDISISPQQNIINTSSNAVFTANTSDQSPSYIWQSDLGQGFQTLSNYGQYSGANTNSLNISNIQINNHNLSFRAISTSGNCIDTSNVAYLIINDTCFNSQTLYDTITTTILDTLTSNITVYDTITAIIYDTLYTNSTFYDTLTSYITIYDTITTTLFDTVTVYLSVTDTLIINTLLSGINPPENSNTIKIFPNPAHTYINIDYGNYLSMSDYQLKIENSLGQQVFQTTISQQSSFIDLSTWGGNGVYFVKIIDPQSNIIENRKIVLQ